MPLNEVAMIAEIELKKWSARRLDKKISSKVAQDHNARQDAVRTTKILMPGEPLLAQIRSAQGGTRNYHYEHTHPWGETRGTRILPTKLYMDYSTEISRQLEECNDLIEQFCDETYYKQAIQKSMAQLGTLVTQRDYPDPSQVKRFFKATIDYFPIANAGDFRVALGVNELANLKQAALAKERQIIEKATESTWTKMAALMEHAATKLGDPKAIFHDTLPSNIKRFTDIVGALNIGQDKFIDEIASEFAPLGEIDPEDLRADEETRKEAAETAQSALSKIQQRIKDMQNAQMA